MLKPKKIAWNIMSVIQQSYNNNLRIGLTPIYLREINFQGDNFREINFCGSEVKPREIFLEISLARFRF